MHIPPVSSQTATASVANQVAQAVAKQVTPQTVSAAVLQRAVGDGDGRTGTAALNDGDAAAQAARQSVDVKA